MNESSRFILAALAAERLYGYAIVRRVAELSHGETRLTAGTLYGALDRMVGQGLVVPDGEEVVGGRARRYYRLSDEGARALRAEADRLERTARTVRAQLRAVRA